MNDQSQSTIRGCRFDEALDSKNLSTACETKTKKKQGNGERKERVRKRCRKELKGRRQMGGRRALLIDLAEYDMI